MYARIVPVSPSPLPQLEFDDITAERDLASKLALLDKAVEEGIPAPPAPWTPQLKAEVLSEIVCAKRAEEAKLRAMLAAITASNDEEERELVEWDARARGVCAAADKLVGAVEVSDADAPM